MRSCGSTDRIHRDSKRRESRESKTVRGKGGEREEEERGREVSVSMIIIIMLMVMVMREKRGGGWSVPCR